MITAKDFLDWRFRNGQENEHEAVTATRFARHCVDQQQAEIDALKSEGNALLAELENLCAVMACHDKTPEETLALEAAKEAIAKALGES